MEKGDRGMLKRIKDWFYIEPELLQMETPAGKTTLMKLALPIFFESLCNNSLGTINTAILSNYSESAVAAIGTANQLLIMFTMLFTVVSLGASAVTSNCLGAKRHHEAKVASFVAIVFSLILSLAVGILCCAIARPTLVAMNLDEPTIADALPYYQIRTITLFLPAMTTAFSSILRCYGITKPGVFAGIISNVVNLALCFAAVNLFADNRAVLLIGIAVACVVGQLGGLAYIIVCFRRKRIGLAKPDTFKKALGDLWKILQIGIPGGMSTVGYFISQTVSVSFVALLSTEAISAKVYFSSITLYVCMFGMSVGNANSVLVGWLCGAKRHDDADRLCKKLWRRNSVLNLSLSLLLILLRIPILSIFTKQEEILAMSLTIFAIDIIQEQSRACSQIYEYALRSTGDTMFSMVGILISCWVNGVGIAYLLGIHLGWGLPGIWIGFAADEFTRAVVTAGRWRTKKWIARSQKI